MRCLRLKSSPAKKTLRLRCFFFMGAGAHTKPRSGRPDNAIHSGGAPAHGRSSSVCSAGPGRNGVGVPADPRLVARPGSTGESGFGALPARACGRSPRPPAPGETTKRSLAPKEGSWTRGMFESPGRGSAGMLSQEAAQRGRNRAKRVRDPRRVEPAPGGGPRVDALPARTRAETSSAAASEKVVPRAVGGVQEVGGPRPAGSPRAAAS